MSEKQLTNWKAIGIGCIVFIGAFIIVFLLPVSVYILYVINIFIMTAFPLSILGALAGKYFSKTRKGAWIGAVLGTILGYWLFISIASKMALD